MVIIERSRQRAEQERAIQTRARLLDAAIECLAGYGYAGTTMRRVAAAAGVSSGAQAHHFPHRRDLITAAVERLANEHVERLAQAIEALPQDTEDPIGETLDRTWAIFSTELFSVYVKVWVAAGEDPELYDRLIPIERRLAETIREHVSVLLGGRLADPGVQNALVTVLATIRGLALTEHFQPRKGGHADPWPRVRETLCTLLSGPPQFTG